MLSAIVASELKKSFDSTAALGGLDLTLRNVEVPGFLRPNGPVRPRPCGSRWK